MNDESLSVRLVDARSLVPYARNARTHSVEQIQQIKGSMLEWGWTNPILADMSAGRLVVAGHGRLVACLELFSDGVSIKLPSGKELPLGKVPVIDCSGWSEAQRKAYVIADNKIALNSGWDEEMLRLELEELKESDFDLDLVGFSEEELDDLLAVEVVSDKDPDEVPAVPETPFSKLGDTWILGPHRVRCGSSTEAADWAALMMGELADIQACDPPYNVAYESKLAGAIQNDNMKSEEFRKFLFDFYSASIAVMKPGAAMYVAHSDAEGVAFRNEFMQAGFKLSSCLIWKKNALVLGRMDYQPISEPILYGWKPGAKHRWYGGRKNVNVYDSHAVPLFERLEDGRYAVRDGDSVLIVAADAVIEERPTSILRHDKPRRSAMHPTMKPVSLWESLIKNNARPGDIVIDGFGGSGTTLMAAERLGMCARLMELDPRFVDVIVVRYALYTGRTPVHAVTGKKFPQEVIDRLSEICSA